MPTVIQLPSSSTAAPSVTSSSPTPSELLGTVTTAAPSPTQAPISTSAPSVTQLPTSSDSFGTPQTPVSSNASPSERPTGLIPDNGHPGGTLAPGSVGTSAPSASRAPTQSDGSGSGTAPVPSMTSAPSLPSASGSDGTSAPVATQAPTFSGGSGALSAPSASPTGFLPNNVNPVETQPPSLSSEPSQHNLSPSPSPSIRPSEKDESQNYSMAPSSSSLSPVQSPSTGGNPGSSASPSISGESSSNSPTMVVGTGTVDGSQAPVLRGSFAPSLAPVGLSEGPSTSQVGFSEGPSTSQAPSGAPSDLWLQGNDRDPVVPPEIPDGIQSGGPGNSPDDNSRGIALGVGIPVALVFLIAGFFVSRHQIATTRQMRLSEAGMYGTLSSILGTMTETRRIAGTGDPPSSFHEGLYHYMGDGTRYLSTNCSDCLETRRNSFYTDDNLGTIPEDQEYEDAIFGQSYYQDEEEEEDETQNSGNRSYLGHLVRGHAVARPNVHVCNSALCDYCSGRNKQTTTFLESPSLWLNRGDTNTMEPMDSLLTFGNDDVTSSRSGQQEV